MSKSSDYKEWFPYPSFRPHQDEMLEKVSEICKDSGVLMVDAPTGSGKTSAISAILANKGNNRIVVALRTVSQVDIYLNEILKIRKNTKKYPTVSYLVGKAKMCKLAHEFDSVYAACDLLKIFSRELLEARMQKSLDEQGLTINDSHIYEPHRDSDLNNEIFKQEAGYRTCCPYYMNSKEAYTYNGEIKFRSSKKVYFDAISITDNVLFPEDLKQRCEHTCPYEVMASAAAGTDIVILNYHHVFDNARRDVMYEWLNVVPEESILLVDEAHNLGSVVCNINSNVLTMYQLDDAINEVRNLTRVKNIEVAEHILPRIKTFMEKTLERNKTPGEAWFDADMFTDFVFGGGISRDDGASVNLLLSMADDITKRKQKSKDDAESRLWPVAEFLFSIHASKSDSAYIPVRVVESYEDRHGEEQTYLKLEVRNIDPSMVISNVADTSYATVLLSGTFSPTDAYELYYFGKEGVAEVKTLPNQFPGENRLIVGAKDATTQAKLRNSTPNQNAIKDHIASIIHVQGNVAIYFTSYAMMNQYQKFCETEARQVGKEVYLEPSNSAEVPPLLERFFKAGTGNNASGRHGVLLGVCGGKLSEGIDYTGDALKAAIVVGLPLAAYTEVQQMTNEYYQQKYGKERGMFVSYTLPALNKALQAIGRVIRSAEETGVLSLCDMRFTTDSGLGVMQYLPEWLSDEMKVCSGNEATALVEEWNQSGKGAVKVQKSVINKPTGAVKQRDSKTKSSPNDSPQKPSFYGSKKKSAGAGKKTTSNTASTFHDLNSYSNGINSHVRILECVDSISWTIGRDKLAKVLKGSSEAFILEKKLDRLYTYGALSEMRIEDIGELIGECVDNGYLESTGGFRPVVVLTEKGKQVMKKY